MLLVLASPSQLAGMTDSQPSSFQTRTNQRTDVASACYFDKANICLGNSDREFLNMMHQKHFSGHALRNAFRVVPSPMRLLCCIPTFKPCQIRSHDALYNMPMHHI